MFLSRFEFFPEGNIICKKPTIIYTTQCLDLFITTKKSLNMHTGKRNPLQLPEDEQYDSLSTQLISDKSIHAQKKLLFSDLNSFNKFATIGYEAHINTEIHYSIHHVVLKQCHSQILTRSIRSVKSKELNFHTFSQGLLGIHNSLVFS